jgi:hypothetical protein
MSGNSRRRVTESPKGPLIESSQEAGKRFKIDLPPQPRSNEKKSKTKMANNFVVANSLTPTAGVDQSDAPESDTTATSSSKNCNENVKLLRKRIRG